MQVGRDFQVGRGFLFRGATIKAVTGEPGVAIGAGNVTEDFVVSTIFANDQKAVLELREGRLVSVGRGVGLNDSLRRDFWERQGAEEDRTEAA